MIGTEKTGFVNLTGATDAQWASLGQLVRLNHGRIQFFTHPFYYDLKDWEGHKTYDSMDPQREYNFYQQRRNRFFKICLDRVPVIIAEQDKEYDLLEERLPKKLSRSVFTIRTRNDDNLPLAFDSREAWFNITERLRDNGVTHAAVGGVAMVLRKFTETDDYGVPKLKPEFLKMLKEFLGRDKISAERWVEYTAQGCAGATALYLALSGIDVALSSVAYPHNSRILPRR